VKTLFALALASLALAAATTPSQAASFSCYGRLTVTERAICANAQLSAVDSEMASFYYADLKRAPRAYKPILKRNQAQWLRSRNSCGASVGCLMSAYNQRLDELGGQGG
jgi:uncharacterized protein